jgi:hypothetical protein
MMMSKFISIFGASTVENGMCMEEEERTIHTKKAEAEWQGIDGHIV